MKKLRKKFKKININDYEVIFVIDEDSDISFNYLLELKDKKHKYKDHKFNKKFWTP